MVEVRFERSFTRSSMRELGVSRFISTSVREHSCSRPVDVPVPSLDVLEQYKQMDTSKNRFSHTRYRSFESETSCSDFDQTFLRCLRLLYTFFLSFLPPPSTVVPHSATNFEEIRIGRVSSVVNLVRLFSFLFDTVQVDRVRSNILTEVFVSRFESFGVSREHRHAVTPR